MNGMLELMMRGLLVLALAGGVIACSDDDGDEMTEATGGSESGGSDETGGTTDATGGAMEVTSAQCMEMTSSLLPDACKTCVCDEAPAEAAACGDGCVAIINCVGTMCAGMTDDDSCATTMCTAELFAGGGAFVGAATAAGDAFTACSDVCIPEVIDEDAGM